MISNKRNFFMFCQHCSGVLKEKVKHCPYCGAKQFYEENCPYCNAKYTIGENECKECGYNLPNPKSDIRYCPNCGCNLDIDGRYEDLEGCWNCELKIGSKILFCKECGTSLKNNKCPKCKNNTKDITWNDILSDLENAMKKKDGINDPVQLAAIKKKLIGHLDTLAEEPVDRGVINVVSKWADITNEKVVDFHIARNVYPNILLANTETFDRIDKYLKKHPENLSWGGFGTPPEFEGLSGFSGTEYYLEFCIDKKLGKNEFHLVYDETPSFDGEEKQSIKKQENAFIFKKAA